ncbi:MAG: hypothetical protein QM770_08660 [Tepidisphaeraceae bacterium]
MSNRILSLLAFLALAAPAYAEPLTCDANAAQHNPLLLLAPDAAKMDAPDWVKPGMRISLYGMSGTVPAGGEFTADDKGDFATPDGKRFARADCVGTGGHGFMQVDVIAVGDHAIALNTNLYTIVQPGDPPMLLQSSLGGSIGPAAGPNDLWIHPAILAQAQQFATKGLTVLRGDYPIGEKKYPSLCIVSRAASGYQSQAYDLKTGVLVSSTSVGRDTTAGPSWQAKTDGVTISKFIGIRQTNPPGLHGKNPAWVATAQAALRRSNRSREPVRPEHSDGDADAA